MQIAYGGDDGKDCLKAELRTWTLRAILISKSTGQA